MKLGGTVSENGLGGAPPTLLKRLKAIVGEMPACYKTEQTVDQTAWVERA